MHACMQVTSLVLGKPDDVAFRTPLFHAAAGAVLTMFNSVREAPPGLEAPSRRKNDDSDDSDDDAAKNRKDQ